jgi:exopolyphosphatase/pppGpp-phosphohydrolase
VRTELLQAGASGQMPIAILHIGAERSAIAAGIGAAPQKLWTFALGVRKIAANYFRHQPPTAGELEQAIMMVEDAIAPLRDKIPVGAKLFTADPALSDIARAVGISDAPSVNLTLDAVEMTFQRLAAVVHGRSASREGLPENNDFAATLLILRECLHHLGFSSITLMR